MTEAMQWLHSGLGLISAGVFALLFAWGGLRGSPGLWVRRWLGGVGFATAMNALSAWHGNWSPLMLGYLVMLPAALSLPYGAEDMGTKIFLRTCYGLAAAGVSCFVLWPLGAWGLWGFQVALGVASSVWWGVRNPTSSVAEQGFIGLALVATVPFGIVQ